MTSCTSNLVQRRITAERICFTHVVIPNAPRRQLADYGAVIAIPSVSVLFLGQHGAAVSICLSACLQLAPSPITGGLATPKLSSAPSFSQSHPESDFPPARMTETVQLVTRRKGACTAVLFLDGACVLPHKRMGGR